MSMLQRPNFAVSLLLVSMASCEKQPECESMGADELLILQESCLNAGGSFNTEIDASSYAECDFEAGDLSAECRLGRDGSCYVACVPVNPNGDTAIGTEGDGADGGGADGGGGMADLISSSGNEVCIDASLIDWSGEVYFVGYGFGTSSDWSSTSHVAYVNGEAWCYGFDDGLYRTTAWDGGTGWANLNLFCTDSGTPDPLCYRNTPSQGDGIALCFNVVGGEVSAASVAQCEGT